MLTLLVELLLLHIVQCAFDGSLCQKHDPHEDKRMRTFSPRYTPGEDVPGLESSSGEDVSRTAKEGEGEDTDSEDALPGWQDQVDRQDVVRNTFPSGFLDPEQGWGSGACQSAI